MSRDSVSYCNMNQEQEQEIIALPAIYGDLVSVNRHNIRISIPVHNEHATLECRLPADYPQTTMPSFTHHLPFCLTADKNKADLIQASIISNLSEIFVPGNVVIYEWVEYIREFLEIECACLLLHVDDESDFNAAKLERVEVYHSSVPYVEKKSIFIAHVARVYSLEDVSVAKLVISKYKNVDKATHNIAAYRIFGTKLLQDFDDDGETLAGKRLLRFLELSGADNVYVVVSRWYGGVQLGPRRFKIINDVASDLLKQKGW